MAAEQQMVIRTSVDVSSVMTDLSRVVREFERFGDALSRSARQATEAQQEIKSSTEQSNAAVRSLLIESIKGFEDGKISISGLIEQGGRLKDTFGGVGPAIRATGGYVGELVTPLNAAVAAVAALGVAYYVGEKETTAYGNALILSGNAVGQTSGQLQDMAASIARSNGALTQSAAADAITTFVQAGVAGAESLQQYSAVAANFERVTGQSVGATAEVFKALEDAPLEASLKLNNQLNYLTAATYQHIKALQEEGRYAEAGRVATDAYADTLHERTKQMVQNLGLVQTGWNAVVAAMKHVGGVVVDAMQPPTDSEQLAKYRKMLADTEGPERWKYASGPNGKEVFERRTGQLRSWITAIEGKMKSQEDQAKAQAERGPAIAALERWNRAGERFLSPNDKRDREVKVAKNEGVAAGVSQKEIDDRVSAIQKSYQKKGGSSGVKRAEDDGLRTSLEAVREEYRIKARDTEEGIRKIDSLRKQGLLTEYDVIRRKRDLRLEDLKNQEDEVQAELRILRSKKGSPGEKQNLEFRSRQIEQQRGFVNGEADRSFAEQDATSQNAVLKIAQDATDKVRERTRALEEQNTVYGLSKEEVQQLNIVQLERQISDLEATESVIPGYVEALRERVKAERELQQVTQKSENLKTADEKQKKDKEESEKNSKKMSDDIGGVFKDGFVNLLEGGGRDAMDKIGEGLRKKLVKSLADAFYDATLKDAVEGFAGWLTGALKGSISGGGASGSKGSSSGFGGLLGAVSGLLGGGWTSATAGISNLLGGDTLGTFIGLNGWTKSANGNVFSSPGLHAYANSVVGRPTFFPFANGIGLMGEAGPEAIMPLRRGSDGRLGVSAEASGGSGGLHYAPTNVFNIDSRSDRGSVLADLDRALQANNKGQMEQLKRLRVVPQ